MEYSDTVQGQIEPAFAGYPHRLIRASRLTMGLALFSRFPIEAAEVHRAEETRIPVFEVRLVADGAPFTFMGGHPWPPLHRSQIEAITRVAALAETPLVVAGDFNAAPWSYTMGELAERAEVRLVRRELDLSKTFYSFAGFGLPLDHVLVSDAWQMLAIEYGAPGGCRVERGARVALARPARAWVSRCSGLAQAATATPACAPPVRQAPAMSPQ